MNNYDPESLGFYQAMQQDCKHMLNELGHCYKILEVHELIKLQRIFDRCLFTSKHAELYKMTRAEIICGAMIAKHQLESEIDGAMPSYNKICGPIPLLPHFLGIGQGWDDLQSIYNKEHNSWKTNEPQPWIHSGTTYLEGIKGNAVKIGYDSVHVIFGIETLTNNIINVNLTIDGKEKLPIMVNKTSILPNTIILQKNSHIKAEITIFSSDKYVYEIPILIGVSYISEDALRYIKLQEFKDRIVKVT